MQKSWSVTLHPRDEVYGKFREYLIEQGIDVSGNRSKICPIVTSLLEEILIEKMEKKHFFNCKS